MFTEGVATRESAFGPCVESAVGMMHKRLATVLALGVSMLGTVSVAAAADDTESSAQAQPATRQVAALQLELRAGDNQVASWAEALDFGAAKDLALSSDGHAHAVRVAVTKVDADGKKLRVQVGYQLDGKSVLETKTVDAKAGKKQTVRAADGSVAIAVTVEAKTVPADEETGHHIDLVVDTSDPLAGV